MSNSPLQDCSKQIELALTKVQQLQELLFEGYLRIEARSSTIYWDYCRDAVSLCQSFYSTRLQLVWNKIKVKVLQEEYTALAQADAYECTPELIYCIMNKSISEEFDPKMQYFIPSQLLQILLNQENHQQYHGRYHSLLAFVSNQWNINSSNDRDITMFVMDEYQTAMTLAPNDEKIQHEYGLALAKLKKYKQALHHYNLCLWRRGNHNHSDYYYGAALCYKGQEMYKQALDFFKKSIKALVADTEPNHKLIAERALDCADCCKKLKDYNKSRDYYMRAIKVYPEKEICHEYANFLKDVLGDYNAALNIYLILDEEYPNHYEYLLQCAHCYGRLNRECKELLYESNGNLRR